MTWGAVEVRLATDADRPELVRLAQRDSMRLPDGELLIGIVDGELRAAVSVVGGPAIADPFHPTANLRALLETRALQIHRGYSPSGWRRIGRRLAAASSRRRTGVV